MGSGGGPLNWTGAALMPQLPVMTVVTPCESFGSIAGVRITAVSSWVCVSIKPGASARVSASMTADAVMLSDLPIATMRSPRRATSVTSGAVLLPSRTVALRMSVSQRSMLATRIQGAGAQDIG